MLQAPSQLPPHSAAILSPQDMDKGYYYQPQTHRLFVLQVLHVSNRKSGSEATSLTSLQRISPHCPSTNSFLITYSKARGKVGRGSLAHLIKGTLRLESFPSVPAINQKLKSEVALEWEHCRQLYTCCVQWHVLRWLSVAPIGWPPSKNGLPTDHTLNTAKSSMAGLGVAPTRK